MAKKSTMVAGCHNHTWVQSSVCGYWMCANTFMGAKSKPVSCGAAAHCPGCLGHVVQGVMIRLCSMYADCYLPALPTRTRAVEIDRFTVPIADQQSLF
ncbi:hypothetical protein [Tengunoibacter tsumagoiensis]|uniref:Uncharacterized protein n=1 Tax=Tengunoibacter tsumagoiensis TaxID=2014871 RepID=A0A401ZZ21_9CHLR|nr:hypothetical protein [Tengunoibacter tsumagoiensis]GCE12118.1 hypothetical protein KTT_19770 [Tengunoibacter tsumagoiensis]